jgi:hypothetical protein
MPYLKEIGDDHMNRVCLGPAIVDEKEVNHCADSPDQAHKIDD